jgi:hypothetical protein
MDAALPSYHDAIRRTDWLDLVTPYCYPRDYAALCRVSTRFYARFARRLWSSPLRMARALGLHRENGESFFCRLSPSSKIVSRPMRLQDGDLS